MENGKLSAAINFAIKKHGNQTDKGGVIYTEHLFEVMCSVYKEHRVVAVLHDVVEDTDATLEEIEKAIPGITPWELNAIDRLSRRENESHASYLERMFNFKSGKVKDFDCEHVNGKSASAVLDVKDKDFLHNISPGREIPNVSERNSMWKRYEKVAKALDDANKLINKINSSSSRTLYLRNIIKDSLYRNYN